MPPTPPVLRRLDQADSLRGIAALAVVAHHVFLTGLVVPQTVWQWRWMHWTPLDIIVEGRFPVILFFILSGAVLARALDRPRPYAAFAVGRICRIWLPLAVALLAAAAVSLVTIPDAWPSAWPDGLLRPSGGIADLLRRLALPADRRETLDPVVWSLAHELRLSLLFPLMLLASRRFFPALAMAAVVAHVCVLAALPWFAAPGECPNVLHCRPINAASLAGSVALDAYFAVFFVIGIGLARRLRDARPWSARDTWIVAGVLVLMNGHRLSSDLLYGAGGAALVWLACARRSAWLSHAWMRQLGRVSFSLYLVHVPLIVAAGPILRRALPDPVVAIVLIPLAIALARLFHAAVEAPAHRLGRRLALSIEADAIPLRGRPLGVLD